MSARSPQEVRSHIRYAIAMAVLAVIVVAAAYVVRDALLIVYVSAIFAIGLSPIVRIIERELLTPVGLRTLERADPGYKPRYQGPPEARDGAYHQGTVWPWLLGPFIDAYLIAFGRSPENLAYCRGLIANLEAAAAQEGCIGSIAEIYDAEEPRYPRGCPAQAWSVAEVARVKSIYGWDS